MIYRGQELQLRSGDVILYRSNFVWKEPITYVSAAVRFFTRYYFNHCGIVVEKNGKLYINEALAEGIVSRPLEDHLDRSASEIQILRPRFVFNMRYVNDRAISKEGTPYDYSSLVLYEAFYRATGIWLGRKHRSAERRMFCSEYVAWCFSLPGWWYYSAKELGTSNFFDVIFFEKESGVAQDALPAVSN